MNTDPVAFFREDFPAFFNAGVAQLEERANGGDDKAKARHADIAGARGGVHVLLEGGGGSIWLAIGDGKMEACDAEPDDRPARIGIAVPVEAARAALQELEDIIDEDKAARRIARIASAEVEAVLEGHTLDFHVTLTDIPADPEEVTLRISIGSGDPPDDPTFTAKVSWDDIADVRAGELTSQQLLGRLKITGDASQAMALGMTLMQRRQKR